MRHRLGALCAANVAGARRAAAAGELLGWLRYIAFHRKEATGAYHIGKDEEFLGQSLALQRQNPYRTEALFGNRSAARWMRRIGPVAAATLTLAAPLFAQKKSDEPELPRLVENIDVRVIDRDGHPVPGLTASDFEIHEDGVRQDVRLFVDGQHSCRRARRTSTEPARRHPPKRRFAPIDPT